MVHGRPDASSTSSNDNSERRRVSMSRMRNGSAIHSPISSPTRRHPRRSCVQNAVPTTAFFSSSDMDSSPAEKLAPRSSRTRNGRRNGSSHRSARDSSSPEVLVKRTSSRLSRRTVPFVVVDTASSNESEKEDLKLRRARTRKRPIQREDRSYSSEEESTQGKKRCGSARQTRLKRRYHGASENAKSPGEQSARSSVSSKREPSMPILHLEPRKQRNRSSEVSPGIPSTASACSSVTPSAPRRSLRIASNPASAEKQRELFESVKIIKEEIDDGESVDTEIGTVRCAVRGDARYQNPGTGTPESHVSDMEALQAASTLYKVMNTPTSGRRKNNRPFLLRTHALFRNQEYTDPSRYDFHVEEEQPRLLFSPRKKPNKMGLHCLDRHTPEFITKQFRLNSLIRTLKNFKEIQNDVTEHYRIALALKSDGTYVIKDVYKFGLATVMELDRFWKDEDRFKTKTRLAIVYKNNKKFSRYERSQRLRPHQTYKKERCDSLNLSIHEILLPNVPRGRRLNVKILVTKQSLENRRWEMQEIIGSTSMYNNSGSFYEGVEFRLTDIPYMSNDRITNDSYVIFVIDVLPASEEDLEEGDSRVFPDPDSFEQDLLSMKAEVFYAAVQLSVFDNGYCACGLSKLIEIADGKYINLKKPWEEPLIAQNILNRLKLFGNVGYMRIRIQDEIIESADEEEEEPITESATKSPVPESPKQEPPAVHIEGNDAATQASESATTHSSVDSEEVECTISAKQMVAKMASRELGAYCGVDGNKYIWERYYYKNGPYYEAKNEELGKKMHRILRVSFPTKIAYKFILFGCEDWDPRDAGISTWNEFEEKEPSETEWQPSTRADNGGVVEISDDELRDQKLIRKAGAGLRIRKLDDKPYSSNGSRFEDATRERSCSVISTAVAQRRRKQRTWHHIHKEDRNSPRELLFPPVEGSDVPKCIICGVSAPNFIALLWHYKLSYPRFEFSLNPNGQSQFDRSLVTIEVRLNELFDDSCELPRFTEGKMRCDRMYHYVDFQFSRRQLNVFNSHFRVDPMVFLCNPEQEKDRNIASTTLFMDARYGPQFTGNNRLYADELTFMHSVIQMDDFYDISYKTRCIMMLFNYMRYRTRSIRDPYILLKGFICLTRDVLDEFNLLPHAHCMIRSFKELYGWPWMTEAYLLWMLRCDKKWWKFPLATMGCPVTATLFVKAKRCPQKELPFSVNEEDLNSFKRKAIVNHMFNRLDQIHLYRKLFVDPIKAMFFHAHHHDDCAEYYEMDNFYSRNLIELLRPWANEKRGPSVGNTDEPVPTLLLSTSLFESTSPVAAPLVSPGGKKSVAVVAQLQAANRAARTLRSPPQKTAVVEKESVCTGSDSSANHV